MAPNGQFTLCHRTQQQQIDFLAPNFEEYFHSAAYERSRMIEAGSCEGCMRACWIDTAFPRARAQADFEMARTWARLEGV